MNCYQIEERDDFEEVVEVLEDESAELEPLFREPAISKVERIESKSLFAKPVFTEDESSACYTLFEVEARKEP
jgi:hypothetical protein